MNRTRSMPISLSGGFEGVEGLGVQVESYHGHVGRVHGPG